VADVAEAVRDSSDLLNDQVDGFGAAVGDTFGVEVGQHLRLPGLGGAAEAGDLGDRAGGEGVDHLLGDRSAAAWAGGEGRSQLLVQRHATDTSRFGSPAARQVSSRAECRSVRCSTPWRRMPRIR
jgi:hypothetical protein